MICPECGIDTEGKLNNRKELRCHSCYTILPPQETTPPATNHPAAEKDETPPAKAAPKRKKGRK